MMFVVNRNWLFALIVYFALAFDKCSQCSEIYHVSLQSHPYALPYKWAQVNVQVCTHYVDSYIFKFIVFM